MTTTQIGRPRRQDRSIASNIRLNEALYNLNRRRAVDAGRDHGRQLERICLLWEAALRLGADGKKITLAEMEAEADRLWAEIEIETAIEPEVKP